MLVLLALLAPAHAADCESGPTTPAQMEAHVDDALFAFATLDEQGVYDAADEASAALDCMSEVLDTTNVAAFHRLQGIRAFMAGNADAALTAFQAARAIEPGYELSSKIAPEGGRLYRLYQQAAEAPDGATAGFRTPRGIVAYVDGIESDEVSVAMPSVVQYASRGDVVWTGYVAAGDQPPRDLGEPVAQAEDALPDDPEDLLDDMEPAEEVAVAEAEEPEVSDDLADLAAALDEGDEAEAIPTDVELEEPRKSKKAKKARQKGGGKGLRNTGLVLLGAGAAAWTTSAVTRMSFNNDPTQGKYVITNTAYYSSVGLGVAGAGLLVTGALVNVEF